MVAWFAQVEVTRLPRLDQVDHFADGRQEIKSC
jgi:hypothetical protein